MTESKPVRRSSDGNTSSDFIIVLEAQPQRIVSSSVTLTQSSEIRSEHLDKLHLNASYGGVVRYAILKSKPQQN